MMNCIHRQRNVNGEKDWGTRILMWTLVLVWIAASLWTPFPSLAAQPSEESQRVFDKAGLFSTEESQELEQSVGELRKAIKQDVVILTTASTGGKSSREYADDFYDEGGFGFRKNYSGVLFLIDMDNRELTISTSGDMIHVLTDKRIEDMLDSLYGYASDGDYAGAARSFLDLTKRYVQKGITSGQYNYDTETGKISIYRSIRWYEATLAAVCAAFAGLTACLSVQRQYAMKGERLKAGNSLLAYRASSQFCYSDRNDLLIDKRVSQVVIPTPKITSSGGGRSSGGGGGGRSSTHTSSMGRSHGGGSRKF